jgi:hypothetical protein
MTSTGSVSSRLDDHEGRRRRVGGALALLALAALVALSWVLQQPPDPVPASAPATAFSAERAYTDLQRIAGPEPTPIGSVGSDAIRDHLAAVMSATGSTSKCRPALGVRPSKAPPSQAGSTM